MILWFTGQPGSGKTTLANLVGANWVVDGDDLRKLDNPGYDEAGRRTNIDRAQAIASYLPGNVAVALVAPYRDQREAFKANMDVVEVYLHTVEARGREHFFAPGYEPPETNFIDIDTGKLSIQESLEKIAETVPWINTHFS